MSTGYLRLTLAAVLAALLSGTIAIASADEQKGLSLQAINEVEVVVVNEKGEKEVMRVDAAKARVVPGDKVFFIIRFENLDKEEAGNVVITNPVPEHMILKPHTTYGESTDIIFSIDGGKSFDRMENLKVKDEDGKERPPKPEEYTHVKWVFASALPPGATGEVGFTAIVE